MAQFEPALCDSRATGSYFAEIAHLEALLDELGHEPELSFADLAGLPNPAQAKHLASQMQRELWS